MTFSHYLLAFAASLLFVGLRSWQQLNVVHRKYRWIPPTSYCMAFCEVFLIGWMAGAASVEEKLLLAFFLGSGAGIGSVSSTWMHDKLRLK